MGLGRTSGPRTVGTGSSDMSPPPQKLNTSILILQLRLGATAQCATEPTPSATTGAAPVHAMEALPNGCERVVLWPELTASCNDHRQETHTVANCSAVEE
jgi:hypothetical protein